MTAGEIHQMDVEHTISRLVEMRGCMKGALRD